MSKKPTRWTDLSEPGQIAHEDNCAWFARKVLQMRADVQAQLGLQYTADIRLVMDEILATSQRLNVSAMKAFEYLATPLLDGTNNAKLWLLGAAVAELYILGERAHPRSRPVA
jgi:hypothetical protein